MAEEQNIYREYGISGASAWGLSGEDPETEQKLQGSAGIQTWEEMRRGDHNAAAMIAGLTLPIRRASWEVVPASSKPADEEAAEFLEQCMHDMSHSWEAMVVDALTMFPFGWAYLEQVMKKRAGLTPQGDLSRSKYNDNRIGWRKMALRPQTTLDHWGLDEGGGIKALYQTIPNREEPVPIPIQRALLFRTTTEGNQPEGVSIFRPAWRPWMHRKRLEMVEGMAFTRNFAGILSVHLGPGATSEKAAGQESDEWKARQLIKDSYEDRLMGVIQTDNLQVGILEGPRGTNLAALGKTITRKDHEMARAALAHFIILALEERGGYALAKDESDLFLMAVAAYLESMQEVIQRFAVERLFRLNVFPGLTELPELQPTAIYKPNLGEVAEAINNLAQAQLLTVDDSLEQYIRSLAGWPELPAELSRAEREKAKPQPLEQEEEPEVEPVEQPEEPGEEDYAERFQGRGRPRTYLARTRQYEEALSKDFEGWARDVGKDVSKLGTQTTEEQLWASLDDWLLVGLLLLKEKGYEDLLAAYILGFGSSAVGPDDLDLVRQAQSKNDDYLTNSLFADIRGKLEGQIAAILLLLKYNDPDEAWRLIETTLMTLAYRVPLYGGTFWEMINRGIGQRLTERGTTEGPPVRRVMDPMAEHCTTCPPKEHEYPSWEVMAAEAGVPGEGNDECDGRCRCHVEMLVEGVWIWA